MVKGRLYVLLAILLVLPAPAAAAATPIKVLQLNICHSGVVDCFTGDAVMTKAKSVIGSVQPHVLSVNEACSGDVEPFRQAMGGAPVAAFVAAQRPAGNPVLCNNGQEYGNIIIVAASLAGPTVQTGRYAAQDQTTEMRTWACIAAGRLNACTTHLSARSSQTAMAQCKELLARAAAYPGLTVVSGDMNMRYQGNPNVQDCNPSGFYRKGDGNLQHIFSRTGLAFVSGTKISMAGTTDHPAWTITVSMP